MIVDLDIGQGALSDAPPRTSSPISFDDGIPNVDMHSSSSSSSELGGAPRLRAPWKRIRLRLGPQPSAANAHDDLPEGPAELVGEEVPLPSYTSGTVSSGISLRIPLKVKTAVNKFGLFRTYRRRPTAVPDLRLDPNQLNNPKQPPKPPRKMVDIIWPYPNVSAFLIGHWRRTGSNQKSDGEIKGLQEILGSPLF